MTHEFFGISDKKISTKFLLIKHRKDLDKYIINKSNNQLRLVINVSKFK